MPVITLTTDFGLRDHYASALRGAIIRHQPQIIVSDISHQVAAFDIAEAAYILSHAFKEYPAGSIHLVAVGSGGGRFGHIALKLQGHFFVGCDNGLFSLLSDENPEQIVQIATRNEEPSSFLARDLYLPAAIKLATGASLESLGPALSGIAQRRRPVSPPEADALKGIVVYVDSFGNLITNITRAEFQKVGRSRNYSIQLIGDEITEIHRNYGDVPEGEKVAFFNSAGVLEIAMNNGNAAGLLMMRINSVVRVLFG
jgi:S-adenosyl-L-methionine hydrolase (adenosine-forming)